MGKIKNLKLSVKLVSAFLILSIIPLMIIGSMAVNSASDALSKEAFAKLEATKKAKQIAIDTYFHNITLKIEIFADSSDVVTLYNRLLTYHNDMKTSQLEITM